VINDELGQVALEAKECGIALQFPNALKTIILICDGRQNGNGLRQLIVKRHPLCLNAVIVRLRQTRIN
jgi:hypothetical protein